MIQKTKTLLNTFLFAALIFTLGACSPTIAQRGNMLEDYQVVEIKKGESSRSDVLKNLGSPTSKSTFDNNVWYYIGQKTEKRGVFDPKVVEEKIYLVAFDDEGIVEAIQPITRERMSVPYARDKTQTHGTDTTVVKQLLGNLGKFNPQTEK